ncbi:MAG: acetylxylan esterase [Planctomycetes bacterium]|nr:acetylxylan esterase [Planctomycetota bacterium]
MMSPIDDQRERSFQASWPIEVAQKLQLRMMRLVRYMSIWIVCCLISVESKGQPPQTEATRVPRELRRWLEPQDWQRDADGPVLSLGDSGAFDDTHIFAPCVAKFEDEYFLWYSGSTGTVAKRVFDLGLATGRDGRVFTRRTKNPVYRFGDGKQSILTATLLRNPDGTVLREQGHLRMWFSSTHFSGGSGRHALYETRSRDGIAWEEPSPAQLEHVYAPTILKEGVAYRMWYTDVSGGSWQMRMATSQNGTRWKLHPDPVLKVEQAWERSRLFYPTVIKADGVYLMWYGSYWAARPNTTAIGVAASLDGYRWYRSPANPVLRPDPNRPWESHYTTSQSVIRQTDGSFRIWYASRKKPPFVNKYFAINTAIWSGPVKDEERAELQSDWTDRASFTNWQRDRRDRLATMLGLQKGRVPLAAEARGTIELGDVVAEKWVYTSEAGSRVPAVLYRPKKVTGTTPGVVLTFGHGGSKSHPCYQYIGQLYAKLGIACLAADPIGEEERHHAGKLGTRAHDPHAVHHQAWSAGRPIMGKLVGDAMRGVDFLLSRDDIDPQRIGVVGNSLGGAKAGWMATLDSRLRFAIVSGWAFDDIAMRSKFCTRTPNERMREELSWSEYLALTTPHCDVLITNGDADTIIDRDANGSAWIGTQAAVDRANAIARRFGHDGNLQTWLEPGGGHRPYPAHPEVVRWLLKTVSLDQADPSIQPTSFGDWCDQNNITLERLYGTPPHLRGATVVERKVRYLKPSELSVLKDDEAGNPAFTLAGWLKVIAK